MGSRIWKTSARACALLCGLAALAGGASAQTLGPRPAQLEALVAGNPDEPIALARFLRSDEPAAFARYLSELEQDLLGRGGQRLYGGRIDPGLAGAALPYDVLVLDLFPSRRACVESLRALDPVVVSLGLEDAFVLALRPWGRGAQLAARALAAVFGTLLAREVGEAPALTQTPEAVAGSREISPDPEALRAFERSDPGAAFAMLNLNQFRAQARYAPDVEADPELSGESAYGRYARVAVPQVLRRGGRVLFAGEPIGTLIGAEGVPLDRPWDQLVLVHYPSRRALGDLLADPDYRAAARHRSAGLAHATLLAIAPWPEFAPSAE